MATPDAIEAALHEAAGGRARLVRLDDAAATVMLDVAGMDEAERGSLEEAVRSELDVMLEGRALRLALTAERSKPKLIAVGSGKGGVGKSTLSANLAVAMARKGRSVGLVDADIYGPSIPTLMGRENVRPEAEGKKLIPVASDYDVPFLSMGQLVDTGQPVAWRGPMAGKALTQLIDAHWSEARELVVDLPPGTGDIQLSMVQSHKPAAAVIVSTPQDLSLIDAARAIAFFDKAGVPVIGLVENMAGYVCPHCGELSDPFGNGGAEAAAKALGLPFLGRVPLDISIREASDAGVPPAAGDSVQGGAFAAIADKVIAWMDQQGARKMALEMDTQIRALLEGVNRIAMVGASPKPQRASNGVLKYLLDQGYEVIPVNPGHAGSEIHGATVVASLGDIEGKVDLVDIFRNSEDAGSAVDEAIAIGADAVWMQLGVINEEAAARAERAGLAVVMDRCPKIEIPRLGVRRG